MTGGNATAETFAGCHRYFLKHRPCLGMMENLEHLDEDASSTELVLPNDTRDSNLDQIRTRMQEIGYLLLCTHTNTRLYGPPQNRPRLYFAACALELFKFDVPAGLECLQSIETTFKALQMPTLPLDMFLLDDEDEMVLNELEQRCVSGAQAFGDLSSWQKRHQAEFEKAGLRWGHEKVPKEFSESPWWNLLSPREQDIVLYTLLTEPTATSVDVQPYIGRNRVTHADKPYTGAVLPNEKRFLISRRRLRTACESLMLQAFPLDQIDTTASVQTLQSLAGNAWTGTVAMALLFAMWGHVPVAPLRDRN